MTRSLSYSLSTVALFVAGPAVADVSAAELWDEWQSMGESMAQVMAAEEVVETETGLVLRGYTTTFADPDVTVVGRIDEMVMTNNDDGTVTIVPSDVYALTITFEPNPSEDPVNLGINLVSDGLSITAGGEVSARTYDYSAASLTIEDGPISGGDGNPPTIDASIVMRDFAGSYMLNDTDPDDIAYDSTASFSSIEGGIDIQPPAGEDGHMKVSLSMGATELGGAGSLGNFPQVARNPELVPTGFELNSDYTYDRFSIEMDFEDGSDNFAVFYANDGGSIAASFSDTGIDYILSTRGAEARLASTDLPFPVNVAVGSAELSVQIPLAPGEEPSNIAARLAYEDIVLGPQIWNLADPSQGIPRDPITIIADISGAAQLYINLMAIDPTAMDAPPGELRELTLNELRLSVGGAELSGSGDVDFAPGQMMPMPVGSVDLQLSGANALLDAIQAAGIAEPQELAMVRGMLGAFARPGAAPDTLESTIEFGEGGMITANGVPLQ